MNIKVAAFTATKKLYNRCNHFFGEHAIVTHVWNSDEHTYPIEPPFLTIYVRMHKVYEKPDKISAHARLKEWFEY